MSKRYIDGRTLPFQAIYPLRDDKRCRFCEKPLTGKQTSWCSDQCLYRAIDEVQFRRGSSSHIRERVLDRDGGICAFCGIDGEKLQRISDAAHRSLREIFGDRVRPEDCRPVRDETGNYYRPVERMEKEYFKFARKLLILAPVNIGLSCWQADHILEVNAGGTHSLDNLQTLCNRCHKAKTIKFNRRRNQKTSKKAAV